MAALILDDFQQGSQAWAEARLGIPTASNFKRIVTPTGRLSASRITYRAELLAEWALGEVFTDFESEWMQRGIALEPQAIEAYNLVTDNEPKTVGLVYKDESKMIAASPDRLIGKDGLLEIKCPAAKTHILYLAQDGVPPEYVLQVQGQLWVTGREWCDFVSYYPDLPIHTVRMTPDEGIFEAFEKHLYEFVSQMLINREHLIEMGVKS